MFLSGGGNFEIYFNGQTITWTVKSYQGNTKTTVSVSASKNSTRCSTGARLINKDDIAQTRFTSSVYPNPTKDKVTLDAGQMDISEANISIIDILGKTYNTSIIRKSTDAIFEIDLTTFREGLYFIRIESDQDSEFIRIVKQN